MFNQLLYLEMLPPLNFTIKKNQRRLIQYHVCLKTLLELWTPLNLRSTNRRKGVFEGSKYLHTHTKKEKTTNV